MSIARAGTEAEAASLALGHLGQDAIAQLTDDNIRARAMRLFYASVRDDLLRAKWWSFSKGWVRPSADTTESIGPLSLRFPLPENCLRVRYLDDENGGIHDDESGEWELESAVLSVAGAATEATVLVTNIEAPLVCITQRVDAVRLWDPSFLTAFAYELASRTARKLGRSSTRAAELHNLAEQTIDTASAIDSKERSRARTGQQDTSWLAARRGFRSR